MKKIFHEWDDGIFGAELKKCNGICVKYLKQRDLYEKWIIFTILNGQKSFEIWEIMPLRLIFPTRTKE